MSGVTLHTPRELPLGSKVVVDCSDGSDFLLLGHIDGVYHNCRTERGNQALMFIGERLVSQGDGTFRPVDALGKYSYDRTGL